MGNIFVTENVRALPIVPVIHPKFKEWIKAQAQETVNWVRANRFLAKSGTMCFVPKKNGQLAKVLLGVDSVDDFWAFGSLPQKLPAGNYWLDAAGWKNSQLQKAAIAWGLGCYQFGKYKTHPVLGAKLKLMSKYNHRYIKNIVDTTFLVRDLINTPAEDMAPQKLSLAIAQVARRFRAKVKNTVGAALRKNYPAVYAVGKSSHNAPCLIELCWGNTQHPKVVLVGKGVCFDSGGLDLKPPAAMVHMKKDMAGAANALGVAILIMAEKLPMRVHLIIPAVENLVSSHSYKVGDVIYTRKKKTIEVTNTDAEGRIVLADALTLASEQKPALIVDFATLTGAATVALGAEIPALFSNDTKIAQQFLRIAAQEKEPVWHMPLYPPYREKLDSKIADLKNSAAGSFGGAITAALFLQEFVTPKIPWLHFDIESMNYKSKPGRPEGGEAVLLQTMFEYLRNCYTKPCK